MTESYCPESEYSRTFLEGMKSRMAVSFHKYGPLSGAFPHKVSAIRSLKRRLALFEETGNTDHLIDVANFAMIEFMYPEHGHAHFRATDSDESPGRSWHDNKNPRRDNEGERL